MQKLLTVVALIAATSGAAIAADATNDVAYRVVVDRQGGGDHAALYDGIVHVGRSADGTVELTTKYPYVAIAKATGLQQAASVDVGMRVALRNKGDFGEVSVSSSTIVGWNASYPIINESSSVEPLPENRDYSKSVTIRGADGKLQKVTVTISRT